MFQFVCQIKTFTIEKGEGLKTNQVIVIHHLGKNDDKITTSDLMD